MANTADITVYDGSETYRFSMIGQNPQDILSRAQTEGMAPVSDIDTYDFSPENGTLTVQRFVRVSVKEDNASQMILAPKGKTLSDVFAENEITLGARDTADADLTAALTADIAVQITRAKRVFISADGKRRMEDLNEGTVEDALKAPASRSAKTTPSHRLWIPRLQTVCASACSVTLTSPLRQTAKRPRRALPLKITVMP